jgi:hypothetical protein
MKAVRAELHQLPQQFALSTRDDTLTQTRVLIALVRDNPLLMLKVTALFLLLFFVDVLPVLVKRTVQSSYDSHIQAISEEQFIGSAGSRNAFYQSAANSGLDRIELIGQLSAATMRNLKQIVPPDSPHIAAAQSDAAREIRREAERTFREMRSAPPIRPPSGGLLSVLMAGIRNLVWFFRTKFGV